jgi:hypothetical protein
MKHFSPPAVRVDALDCFRLRAWARAYLWAAGEYDLHTAVDHLQRVAERDMLIERIGQDQVQSIIAGAFLPFRDVESIIDTFEYLVKLRNGGRLRAWLAERTPEERRALKKLLDEK